MFGEFDLKLRREDIRGGLVPPMGRYRDRSQQQSSRK